MNGDKFLLQRRFHCLVDRVSRLYTIQYSCAVVIFFITPVCNFRFEVQRPLDQGERPDCRSMSPNTAQGFVRADGSVSSFGKRTFNKLNVLVNYRFSVTDIVSHTCAWRLPRCRMNEAIPSYGVFYFFPFPRQSSRFGIGYDNFFDFPVACVSSVRKVNKPFSSRLFIFVIQSFFLTLSNASRSFSLGRETAFVFSYPGRKVEIELRSVARWFDWQV